MIIERITGEDYYTYVNENIFKLAGMIDTGFYSAYNDVPNVALGYTNHINSPVPGVKAELATMPRSVAVGVSPGTSGGGSYSTAKDMLRFSKALQDYKLIDTKHLDLLFAGNGIAASKTGDVRIVGHSGGTNGFSTNIDIYPELGYTVIIISNYDEGPKLVNERLRWQLTGHDMPYSIQLSKAELKELEGEYKAEEQPSNSGRKMIMKPGSGNPMDSPIKVVAGDNVLQVSEAVCLNLNRFRPRSSLTVPTPVRALHSLKMKRVKLKDFLWKVDRSYRKHPK